MAQNDMLLDVGGVHFSVSRGVLNQAPEGSMLKAAAATATPKNKPYFIDRDPTVLRYVLNWLRSGVLPKHIPSDALGELEVEANHFGLEDLRVEVTRALGKVAHENEALIKVLKEELRKIEDTLLFLVKLDNIANAIGDRHPAGRGDPDDPDDPGVSLTEAVELLTQELSKTRRT